MAGIEVAKGELMPDATVDSKSAVNVLVSGYDRLWVWFGLSHASWITLPRVMAHEMPDEWQDKMAALLEEWDDHWDFKIDATPKVQLTRSDGRFIKIPEWLKNYRHPNRDEIKQHLSRSSYSQ